MEHRIIVSLSNEYGNSVSCIPASIVVEIRDYDVPEDWEGDIRTDEDGDKYEYQEFHSLTKAI